MDQPREVELELMTVALGIWTLHLTEFALETGVHNLFRICRIDPSDITIVLLVEEREESWKAIAIFEAKTATVANLKRPPDFLVERDGIPIFLFRCIVSEPVRGLIGDVLIV